MRWNFPCLNIILLFIPYYSRGILVLIYSNHRYPFMRDPVKSDRCVRTDIVLCSNLWWTIWWHKWWSSFTRLVRMTVIFRLYAISYLWDCFTTNADCLLHDLAKYGFSLGDDHHTVWMDLSRYCNPFWWPAICLVHWSMVFIVFSLTPNTAAWCRQSSSMFQKKTK